MSGFYQEIETMLDALEMGENFFLGSAEISSEVSDLIQQLLENFIFGEEKADE